MGDWQLTFATGVHLGIYLSIVIIAVSGVVALRKARVRRAEFDRLRKEVNQLSADVKHLLHVEERRFLTELKSSEKKGNGSKTAA